jgi:hypothetical protein
VYDAARKRVVMFGRFPLAAESWALTLSPLAWSHLHPTGDDPGPRVEHAAIYDPIRDRMLIYGGSTSGEVNDTWALTFAETPVAVAISLVRADAQPDVVHLRWQSNALVQARLERRVEASGWEPRQDLACDANGAISFDDRDVAPGTRYGYRLALIAGEEETHAGEVWIEVPRSLRFALDGARPNPGAGGLNVEFTLPEEAPARLDLLDVAGRRVASREMGPLGPGHHTVRLADGLPVGVYLIRLTQGVRLATSWAVVLR